ncbi:MAG: hypothetical protein BWY29_00577 [Microgenomates group bacterium ADurb.Bin238]|nr:MAG: hypothetical protein BWY29_00577 [Microgenomates group bacterium ADurb.Bin238]
MKRKLAWAVSRVFDPVVEIPILLAGSVYYALSNGLRWRFLVMLLVVDALLPALYMVYGLMKGKIKDWDITKREERMGLYFFTIFAHLFGVVAAYAVGKTDLFEILLVFWTMAVVFAVVTLFWKISVHAGTNAAVVAFFNHYYGWDRFWWLVLVLIVVLWSRVEIKKHTWAQVLVGATLALVWVSLGLQWLG